MHNVLVWLLHIHQVIVRFLSLSNCFRLKHHKDDHSTEQADEDGDEDDDDHKPVVKRRGKPKFMF